MYNARSIFVMHCDAKIPISSASEEDRMSRADIAASFQRTAVLHLEERCERAIQWALKMEPSIRHLVVSGGVASNQYVRARLDMVAKKNGLQLLCPPPRLCTDNARPNPGGRRLIRLRTLPHAPPFSGESQARASHAPPGHPPGVRATPRLHQSSRLSSLSVHDGSSTTKEEFGLGESSQQQPSSSRTPVVPSRTTTPYRNPGVATRAMTTRAPTLEPILTTRQPIPEPTLTPLQPTPEPIVIVFNLADDEQGVVENMFEQQLADSTLELSCRANLANWHLAYASDREAVEGHKNRNQELDETVLKLKEQMNELLAFNRNLSTVGRDIPYLLNVSTDGDGFDVMKDIYQGQLVPLKDIPNEELEVEIIVEPTEEVVVEEGNEGVDVTSDPEGVDPSVEGAVADEINIID
ncbi:hypothetical protein LR48_Vigan805s000100 [Vigna angularis]|uniref:Gcp-like domain-containing protein n=1 Tax=Phaseolus angularis TaxID=3914 RepID=A0A0L9TH41_PHAAN|nr:hypothetical protein LR48_Vigan805s000100 [Vigna angularis]